MRVAGTPRVSRRHYHYNINVKLRLKPYLKPFKIFLDISAKAIKYRDIRGLLRLRGGLDILESGGQCYSKQRKLVLRLRLEL